MAINNLFGALQNAVSGLNATGVRTAVTASNVANALTPGYSREIANLATQAGGGVQVVSVTRAGDPFQLPLQLTATGAAAAANAQATILGQFGASLGTVASGAPLSNDITNLQTDFTALTNNPAGGPEQQAVIVDANSLVNDLHGTTTAIQGFRGQADQAIAGAVAQANQDLSQLASLNQEAGSAVSPALFDQQDTALKDLAKQIGISFSRGSTGQVQVFAENGSPLLLGQTAATLSFNQTGIIGTNDAYVPPGSVPGPGQNPILSGILLQPPGGVPAVNITAGLKSGAIGGNLQLRDKILPQAQAQIDEFSAELTVGFEGTGTGYGGTAVQLFTDGPPAGFPPPTFTNTPANVLGYAGRIAVNPIVQIQPWRLRDGTNPTSVPAPGAPGNTAVLTTIDTALTTNQAFAAGTGLPTSATYNQYANAFVGFQAVQAATLQGQSAAGQSLVTAGILQQTSGVSLDQEMVDLQIEKIAYSANAKTLKTAEEMTKTLLNIKA